MARIFERVFGRSAALGRARAAELRGDLVQAAALFAQAGRSDESARVLVLRGDGEAELGVRLRHYGQAVAVAPPESAILTHARRKRAATVLALATEAPRTALVRRDLLGAAAELEEIGDHGAAADAYAQAGDIDAQVRALARAGEIDRLDAVLAEEHARDRERLARERTKQEVTALAASGRRREAAALARASDDDSLRRTGRAIEERGVVGGGASLIWRGAAMTVLVGDEVVVGRGAGADQGSALAPADRGAKTGLEASIAVASAAVSRRHLLISRREGEAVVVDLGSRNGTTLRGLSLAGATPVGDGLDLRLGGEVALTVRVTDAFAPGALIIAVAGLEWIAPLGPARLGHGSWRLERGADDWLELVTDDDPPAFAAHLRLATRVSLLAGDAISTDRDAPAVLEVRGRV